MKKNKRINENKKGKNKNVKFNQNSPLRKLNPTRHSCHSRKQYLKKKTKSVIKNKETDENKIKSE